MFVTFGNQRVNIFHIFDISFRVPFIMLTTHKLLDNAQY